MTKSALFAAALVLSAAAGAQTLYKYERPDGSIVYSDKPVPGAKLLDKLESPSRLSVVPAVPAKPRAAGAQPSARTAARDQADRDVREAEAAVKSAQERLQEGMEPLPGERIGTAGGRSRLKDEYFDRVRSLEQALKDAQARRELAYQQRNDVRD